MNLKVTEEGYYFIQDKAGTVTADGEKYTKYILKVVDSVEVDVKADVVKVDKVIEDETDVKADNKAIGDTVDYKVTSAVPNMNGYKKYFFVVKDTMSKGLKFNDDVAITIGSATLEEDVVDEETGAVTAKNFYVKTSGDSTTGTAIEIVFRDFIDYAAQEGAAITIKYSAEVTKDAAIGVAGNPNTVKIVYSNDPNKIFDRDPADTTPPDEPKDTEPTGKTPDSTVYTYVTAIQLTKVNEDGDELAGAQFQLVGDAIKHVLVTGVQFIEDADGDYYLLKDKTYTKDAPTDDTKAKYAVDDDENYIKYTEKAGTDVEEIVENVNIIATTTADGIIEFKGLSEGTYTIKELTAPDGYNKLKNDIVLTIGWALPGEEDDGYAEHECIWTVSGDDNAEVDDSGKITLEVENKAGVTLPSTGGIGTTMFYVIGSILLLGAVVLFVTKKRTRAEA